MDSRNQMTIIQSICLSKYELFFTYFISEVQLSEAKEFDATGQANTSDIFGSDEKPFEEEAKEEIYDDPESNLGFSSQNGSNAALLRSLAKNYTKWKSAYNYIFPERRMESFSIL